MGFKWLGNRWGLDKAGDIVPAANNAYDLSDGSVFWRNIYVINIWTYLVNLWGPTYYATLQANSAATANQTLVLPAVTTDTLVSRDSVDNLRFKRVEPRIVVATSASSLTPDMAVADIYAYTALAVGLTINAPLNLIDGEGLDFRIKDNGSSQTLTLNAAFRAIGVTIPSATTANKTLYLRTRYNAADSKVDVIGVNQEA